MLYAALGLQDCIAMVLPAWSVCMRRLAEVIRFLSDLGVFHDTTLSMNSKIISMILKA